APAVLEELAYLGEEAFGLGTAFRVALRFRLEFLEQFALPARQVLRSLHGDLDEHIAALVAAHEGKALAAQAELLAGLRAGGGFRARFAAVDRRHLDLAAERRLRYAQGDAAEDVGAVALENRVRPDADVHVEVAGYRAGSAGLPLAAEADAGAVFDARRH